MAAVHPMLAGATPAHAQVAPGLECATPTAFLSINNPTQLLAGPMTTDPIAFSPVGPATVLYNAMGWNPDDGFIYAIANGGSLLRIDPTTGAVTNLGPTTPALPAGIPTGAFDAAGNYYVMTGTNTTMYRIDVATRTATVVTLSAVPSASDIALGPGGFLWSATGNSAPANSIVRINPTTGAVAFFPVPAGALTTTAGLESGFGGMFAYPNGDLGFVRNAPGEIIRVRITNPTTANPTFTVISQQSSPTVSGLDATSCPTPPVSKAAVVAESVKWSLGNALPGDPLAVINFEYGVRPLVPLMGDWDANGTITVGYYHNPNGRTAVPGDAIFFLNNQNDSSAADITFNFFGDPRGYAVAGDYDGNGYDDVAVFRCGNWEIQYLDANGAIPGRTESFRLEAPFSQACTWPAGVPVAGDWDGDGIDGIGTYDLATGTWVLKNTVGSGGPDHTFVFWGGSNSSYPVVGDWDGDGIDTPGYRVGQTWTTRNTVATVSPTSTFVFGVANSVPFTW